jgi:hypothetical protein
VFGCSGPSAVPEPCPLRNTLSGDPLGRFRFERTPGELEVVVRLEIHPELGCGAEEEAEPERGVGTDAAAIVDDLRNAVGRDPERSRQLRLGQRITGQELFAEDFSRRTGENSSCCSVSVSVSRSMVVIEVRKC